MDRFQKTLIASVLALACGSIFAQTQTAGKQEQQAAAQATAAAPGRTTTFDTTPGTVNPMPATSQVEGTAADRTPPGETPVRGTNAKLASPEVATQMAAAADRTSAASGRADAQLVGMQVQTSSGEPLGQVVDVVVADDGRIDALVISRSNTPQQN